jgi:hypothetical protein
MPLGTALLTVAAAAGVLAGPAPTAIIGGILLGFVLPGLALTEILFRRRTLSAVERTVLAPALSLATLITSGLLLNAAGVRLDRTSWTLAAAGVTLVVLVLTVATVRLGRGVESAEAPATERELVGAETVRIRLSERGEAPTGLTPRVKTPRALPGPFAPWSAEHKVEVGQLVRQLLPMILVVAVLAGAGYLSFTSSRDSYDVTVTTLSAAPPGAANAAGNRVIAVTASGLVADNGPYEVRVTDGDGRNLLRRAVAADDRGNWTARLTLPAESRLSIGLFRDGDTSAYRTVLIAAAG